MKTTKRKQVAAYIPEKYAQRVLYLKEPARMSILKNKTREERNGSGEDISR
jgi:hypothetical protein